MTHIIHSTASVGMDTVVGEYSVIEEGVVLGDGVTIGNRVTIHAGTFVGDGTVIADNGVIGRWPRPAKSSTVKVDPSLAPLKIGANCVVGANVVMYRGSQVGDDVLIGDQAFLREHCVIEKSVVIGRGVSVENQVHIGSHTKIQTNAYITAYSVLEDHVFIAPCVITTNDNYMGRTKARFKEIKGPTIKRGARVGGGATLLPGIVVEEECFIAAGAVVNRDTEAATVYVGVPARPLRQVAANEFLEK